MNWLKKTLRLGEKIKQLLKKRPSKSDIENSDWASCCKGPILKKDLEENLWVCPGPCGKHFRIKPIHKKFKGILSVKYNTSSPKLGRLSR